MSASGAAGDPSAQSGAVEFVLLVEAGPLEAQAVLLVESLRRFGGRGADALVTVASPRAERRPSPATVRELERLGARYLALDIVGECPAYPTSWRTHTLAAVERQPGPEVIVGLDSDAVFLGEIGPMCTDAPVMARPVDVKGMGSAGPGDDYEPYWQALCALAGIEVDALGYVCATVDRARVRATHNGGFVAARRSAGLFTAADEVFRASVRAGLRPHAGRGLNVVAGTGTVGVEGSEWWGSGQAAVSVAARRLGLDIAPVDLRINVPMHSWDRLEPKPSPILLAHYHWLLAEPPTPENPMLDPSVVGEAGAAWLRSRVPLGIDHRPAPARGPYSAHQSR